MKERTSSVSPLSLSPQCEPEFIEMEKQVTISMSRNADEASHSVESPTTLPPLVVPPQTPEGQKAGANKSHCVRFPICLAVGVAREEEGDPARTVGKKEE